VTGQGFRSHSATAPGPRPGHAPPVTFTAHIQEATGQAVVLTAQLHVNRKDFGMTWSPLHIASMTALGRVKARFVRA
jgi:polyisoprenoid-binding protein YceI